MSLARRLRKKERHQRALKMAGVALLEQLDGLSGIRNGLRMVAERDGNWQGVPMPLTDQPLVIEPTYPHQKIARLFCEPPKPAEDDGYRIRNSWWSDRLMADVCVIQTPEGGITWGKRTMIHALRQAIHTMACSEAWGIEQEATALRTLATLIPHHAFKKYLLSGMFVESSKRSGIAYLFRKLRPTVALTPHHPSGELRILCALCLHPIAYYEDSWAGAMCPTDDVIAHLMLMRGDEHMLWKRANHHHSISPLAGL